MSTLTKTLQETAVNITVPFSHDDVHYEGMALHNGVDFELVDAPCTDSDTPITLSGSIVVNGETVEVSLSGVIPAKQKKLISLTCAAEGAWPKGVLWSNVTAVNPDEPANPLYLQVVPASSAS